MKKPFIALFAVILCVSLFFACDVEDTLGRFDSAEHDGNTNTKDKNGQDEIVRMFDPDDEFLSGISYPSIYYDNTLSITPLNQRESVCIQLHTNDMDEARNWSILSQENGSANRTLIRERETEKYFEFLWIEKWNYITYGLLSRVHRTDYFIPLFDSFNFIPRFNEDFNGNYPVGIYNGDQSLEKVKEFIEYIWYGSLLMGDRKVEPVIVENGNIIECTIRTESYDSWFYDYKFFFEKESKILSIVERKWVEEPRFSKVDFFEEYGLTLEFVGIWNDYMPMVYPADQMPPAGWVRPSICVVQISSATRLPSMQVSANIITESVRFDNVPFYDIYNGEQLGIIYPGKYWKDYRPVTDIRLGGNDRYTMEIIVKIGGKQEIITVGDKVEATH